MTPEEGEGLNGQLWNVEQVTAELRISRAHLFAMVKAGRFPKGFLLGRRRVWTVAEVRTWWADLAETKQEGSDDD